MARSPDSQGLPDDSALLAERRDHAMRDLVELADQVETGEIDDATAARLRARYRAELEAVDAALAAPRKQQAAKPGQTAAVAKRRLSPRRAIVGTLLLMAAFTLVIVMVGGSDVPSRQGAASGASADAPPALAADPGSLAELEAVVAANPEVVGMRMALADLYFQERQYSPALTHYLTILEGEPTAQEESVALGRVGWMAFVTDQPESAATYLRNSVGVDPNNVEGRLFLGYVLFYGLDDAEGAIPLLEEVLALPDIDPELRADVEGTLGLARAARDGTGE